MNKAVWFCPICHTEGTDPFVVHCPKDGCVVDLVSDRENEWAGKIVAGKYRIIQFLRSGGMADIFEVERNDNQKRYAIKLLKPSFARDIAINNRFRQEANMIARVAHPNIVAFEDFGVTEDGLNYMVMELLNGYCLGDAIVSRPLDPSVAFQIAERICDGMAAVHERGIIHRDIKPDNVFIHTSIDKKNADVKILDLGIAKLFECGFSKGSTLSGTIVGTPQYMSPEQCMGNPCTYSSDIYSIGIVLYQMLFGRVPFEDESPLLVLPRHIAEKPQWNRCCAKKLQIPAKAEDVVLKALAKSPLARHDSIRSLKEDIVSLLNASQGGSAFSAPSNEAIKNRPSAMPFDVCPTIAVAMSGPAIPVTCNQDEDEYMAIEFTSNTYWMGQRHKSRVECNPYLRVFHGKGHTVSVLVNTGPLRDLKVLTQKVTATVGSFDGIHYIYLTHADPDVAGSASEIQRLNPNISIICSEEIWWMIRNQGLDPKRYVPIETLLDQRLVLHTGHQLQFIPVPFCPSHGATVMFDPDASVLFSGSLFSSYSVRNGFVFTFQDEMAVKKFHQSRIPCSQAISNAVRQIEQLGVVPKVIAPQYGNIVTDDNVGRVIDMVSNLRVGMELMEYNKSNTDALALANDIALVFSHVAGKETATALLNRFGNDRGLYGAIDVRKGNTIAGFRIEYTDAIETLLREAQDDLPPELKQQFSLELHPLKERLAAIKPQTPSQGEDTFH